MDDADPLGPRPPPPRRRLLGRRSPSSGIATAGAASSAMKQKFSVPGREGWETNQADRAAATTAPAATRAPLVPVVDAPRRHAARPTPAVRAELAARRGTARGGRCPARASPATARPATAPSSPSDGRTAFARRLPAARSRPAVRRQPEGREARRAPRCAARPSAARPCTSPATTRSHDQSGDAATAPACCVEALLGGLGALLVLGFVFGSLLAFVPLLMAIPAIMTSFLAVYGLTRLTGVSPIVQFLIALIGLGVAIDYSLIIVVRWREERAHGREGDEAIVRAMETAGRAVVFSGTTVAIGLLALVALPLPFLRSRRLRRHAHPARQRRSWRSRCCPSCCTRSGTRLDWPHRRTDDKASRGLDALGAAASSATAGSPRSAAAARPRRARARRHEPAARASPNADTIAKPGDAKQGLVALEQLGHRRGRAAAARGPRRAAPTPQRGRARSSRGVDGIHGAVAPGRPGAPTARRSSPPSRSPTALGASGRDARRRRARRGPRRRAPTSGVGGQPAAERGLHRRRLRQLPADDRADRGRHLRPARARVPLAAAAGSRRCC